MQLNWDLIFTQNSGLQSLVIDISEYDPASLVQLPKNVPIVLLVSTYGEGGPIR